MPPEILPPEDLERLLETRLLSEPPLETSSDTTLLRLLSTLDRNQLGHLMTEYQCAPGEIVFKEGESGSTMYLIRSGRIAILKGDLKSPTVLAYRGPGEVIGEMALLEGQPRSATNVALDNARLLRVERERFQEWVATTPVIGLSIMATLSSRLRAADDMRASVIEDDRQLMQQVSRLRDEKEELLALQRVRQETSDLLVHDLRNPLSIIYGALNMLEMVLPEDSLRDNHDLLDLATSACERMQRLVDSMLDVAKFETGEMALTLSGVNLGPILENAAYQQAIMAQSRGITIEVYVPDDLSLALIDTEKIDRVLINLLDNALKYSPDEGQITVAAQQQGDYIVVSITDAGPGIPPHERERIFERFAQVPGDKPRRRGFGLGLTFCRLAVEAHGGQIWVEAGPEGVGSTFAFTLSLSPT